MRMLVWALVLLCLAATGAVAQESKESENKDIGKVTPAGATKNARSATLIGSGLTGCWATGVTEPWLVWLVQRGNKVWGYYVPNRPNRKGRLQGTLKGNRLEYDWWENRENGTGYFQLADDGLSMSSGSSMASLYSSVMASVKTYSKVPSGRSSMAGFFSQSYVLFFRCFMRSPQADWPSSGFDAGPHVPYLSAPKVLTTQITSLSWFQYRVSRVIRRKGHPLLLTFSWISLYLVW